MEKFAKGELDQQDVVFGVPKGQWTSESVNFISSRGSLCESEARMEARRRFGSQGRLGGTLEALGLYASARAKNIVRENDARLAAEGQRKQEVERERDAKAAFQRMTQAREKENEANYRSRYEAIASPSDAKSFVNDYSGKYDPDHLVQSATKKGYEGGIRFAQRCIDSANREIATQKEVAASVGYVDKTAMYEAGMQIVQCRRQLEEYRKQVAGS